MRTLGAFAVATTVGLLCTVVWLRPEAHSEPRFDPKLFAPVSPKPRIARPPLAQAAEEGLHTIPIRSAMSSDAVARCLSWRGERCADPRPNDHDADGYGVGRDCDDADSSVFPGASELSCNGRDEDCDGEDDCEADKDRDGFNELVDCNDADPALNPRATELPCNGVDEDCSGSDLCDRDGDSVPPPADCDDADPKRNYLARDIPCDGIDQDCSGADCCTGDGDGDGVACLDDCNDRDARIHPGAPVSDAQRTGCVLVDLDCDGKVEGSNCL